MQTPPEPNYRRVRKVAVYLAALFVAEAIFAANESVAFSQTQGPTLNVDVSLVGRAAQDRTLASRITSWFNGKRFRVSVRTLAKLESRRILAPDRPGTVHVWVSIGANSVAHLYFATTPSTKRRAIYLVRYLPLANGLDEMGAERIGQVLHLSTIAIVDGEAETERKEMEQKLLADSDSDATHLSTEANQARTEEPSDGSGTLRPSKALEIHLGYGVEFHGNEGVWHGPRASLEVYLHRAFGLGAIMRTALPNSTTVDIATQRVEGAGIQVFAAYHAGITPDFEVFAYAGPGIELVHHVPTEASDPDVTLAQGQTDTRPNFVAGFGFALGQGVPRFAFALEGTGLFSESRYPLLERRRDDVSATAAGFAPGAAIEVRF